MNAYENTEAQETLRDFAGQINEKLARVEGQLDRLLGTGLAEAIKGQPPMVGALAELRQILGDIEVACLKSLAAWKSLSGEI